MVEPRLPAPMTPERASKLSWRWRVGGAVAALIGPIAFAMNAPDGVLVGCLLAIFWCVGASAEYRGWVKGYSAARREELERQTSGDPR